MITVKRLDLLCVDLGVFKSREKAISAIMNGQILVDGIKITKPGKIVRTSSTVETIPSFRENKYVSRGGLKLERAIEAFAIKVDQRLCLDIGASTGGFTDCLLSFGAGRVYAIDVGYGQLDWRLRTNPRVIVFERTNFRHLKPEQIYSGKSKLANLAVADVSFISLKLLFQPIKSLIDAPASDLVFLIKPQFEAGKGRVGKNGVIKEPEIHLEVLLDVIKTASDNNIVPVGLIHSPLKGPAGNIEFFVHFAIGQTKLPPLQLSRVEAVVKNAHIYFQ
jgi:23S rRNA (cytidine1920-2'-O)/16S rRNA (cytidine1409-2'-O)-methyltransferase